MPLNKEVDWRVKLADEIAEMQVSFFRMASQQELSPDDRAGLWNFGRGSYLPV